MKYILFKFIFNNEFKYKVATVEDYIYDFKIDRNLCCQEVTRSVDKDALDKVCKHLNIICREFLNQ